MANFTALSTPVASRTSHTRFTIRRSQVTRCGRICFHGRKMNFSHVFAGQTVGVTQVGDRIWLRHLHALRFGLFRRRDLSARADRQSLWTESVTYVLGINCHPCDPKGPYGADSSGWTRTSNPPVTGGKSVVSRVLPQWAGHCGMRHRPARIEQVSGSFCAALRRRLPLLSAPKGQEKGNVHSQLFLADVSVIGRDERTTDVYRNANVLYEVALASRQPEKSCSFAMTRRGLSSTSVALHTGRSISLLLATKPGPIPKSAKLRRSTALSMIRGRSVRRGRVCDVWRVDPLALRRMPYARLPSARQLPEWMRRLMTRVSPRTRNSRR